MIDPVAETDRIAATERPEGEPIGHQNWSQLLFVHWRVPAFEIEPLIPRELSVDTFQGDAWVGLVVFHMSGVRPSWFPAVPWISSFHEFNVRTYVHRKGREPGVWFFSLDASSSLAVRIARWKWHLPYHRAAMWMKQRGRKVEYHSERLWPGEVGRGVDIEAEYGDLLGVLDKEIPAGEAVPGTLEHFLVERYILYSKKRNGKLYQGRVHHFPYILREAKLVECRENLLEAADVLPRPVPAHVVYSPGVDVDIFPLKEC